MQKDKILNLGGTYKEIKKNRDIKIKGEKTETKRKNMGKLRKLRKIMTIGNIRNLDNLQWN